MTFWGLIGWIIGGAIIGWLASIITGRNAQQGLIGNIIAGIIGAFVGGLLWSFITGGNVDFGWNVGSFIIALIGAVIVLALYNFITRRA